MFCSNCGKELIKGARYCPYCGTRQEEVQPRPGQQQAQQDPFSLDQRQNLFNPDHKEQQWQQEPPYMAPVPAPKKTGKGLGALIVILVIVIFAVAVRFTYGVVARRFMGPSAEQVSSVSTGESTFESGEQAESTAETAGSEEQKEEKASELGSLRERLSKELAGKDLLIEHATVQYDGGDGTISFVTAFYGNKTRYLKALTVEYLFSKEAGYTMESIRDSDFTPYFPDYAEFSYLEDDEYVAFVSEMKDVDSNERIVKLAEAGIIEQGEDAPEEAEVLDADYLMDSFREQGWSELDPAFMPLMDFSLDPDGDTVSEENGDA